MSFGVKHLAASRRMVQGWYYLLHENLGRKKHLQVPGKHNQTSIINKENKPAYYDIPAVNKSLAKMDNYTVS